MSEITVFDLFCGTGAFSKGIENSDSERFKVLFGIDVLKNSVATFKANHKCAHAIHGDIRKIKRSDISALTGIKRGKLGLVIGGPPCQGFSSIRPFRSVNDDDPRNNLFEEFASFVNFFRPRFFILENVVGLATHKGGNTINQIEECFYGLDYDVEWKILNTAQYGVPQKRERLIMLGAERGDKISFPLPTHKFSGFTIGHRNKEKLVQDMVSDKLSPVLSVMDAINDLPSIKSGEFSDTYTKKPNNDYQRKRRKNLKKLELHESTKHSSKMLEIIKHSGKNINCIPKHLITSGFSSCYSRLDADEPAVTITVNFVHPASNRCIHPYLNRALTPREGARLQSFDDDFIFCGSRTDIVKQIGNAVPPLLGTIIGRELLKTA